MVLAELTLSYHRYIIYILVKIKSLLSTFHGRVYFIENRGDKLIIFTFDGNKKISETKFLKEKFFTRK